MAENDAAGKLSAERARRQRRRSVALALLLAFLVVLFYVIIAGPIGDYADAAAKTFF